MNEKTGACTQQELFDKVRRDAIGLDVEYELATGEKTRRIYLDSTASTLALGVADKILKAYLPFYANTHTVSHFSARLSTIEYQWVHDIVLDFVGADPEKYASFFVGSGTTGGINRIARTLKAKYPKRDVVITSIMEHHSNDLPHRRHAAEVVHIPVAISANSLGCVNLSRLEAALKEYQGRVNYVAITGVSNVTGIINPIYDIAELAHKYDTLIVVDAAQMAAHVPIDMSQHKNPARSIDMLVFSGHKIYAPGSPGIVITRKDLFEGVDPVEVGGGMVKDVYINRYEPTDVFPDREEAGTPNITGAMSLGAVLYTLKKIGMPFIAEDENELIEYAMEKIKTIKDVIIYGETDTKKCSRAGAISFNIMGMDHGLAACILNDYFNVSVRNACFCAHPYVREMISEALADETDELSDEELEAIAEMHKGMVRASFGIYNTRTDVDILQNALTEICGNKDFYAKQYNRLPDGSFEHKTFKVNYEKLFSIKGCVDNWLNTTEGDEVGKQD